MLLKDITIYFLTGQLFKGCAIFSAAKHVTKSINFLKIFLSQSKEEINKFKKIVNVIDMGHFV